MSRHIVVIGGGIAGVSAGYFLCAAGQADRVTVVEAERQLAHHTTGRSAALLIENYGAGPVRPLTSASLDFLHDPPGDLVEHSLLTPRGIMTVATSPQQYEELDEQLAQGAAVARPIVEITHDDASAYAPHIRFEADHRVMFEEHAFNIDVAGLHQAFVRGLRRHGGEIATSTRVDAARPSGDGWHVETTGGPISADVLVNCAGAWADVVAKSAGVEPVGVQPMRRTAFMVASPFDDSERYPFVASADHSWYLGPDGRQFLCSPGDETPSEPCDARPEELDIAVAIERINANTTLDIRSINSSWAGLRTFAPDRAMVVGPEPGHPNFIWCAGQGGTGIQTSPGAGRLVADLVTRGKPSADLDAKGLDPDALSPARFRY